MQQFVARQPIFNTRLHIEAYELLFRSGTVNQALEIDPIMATTSVVNSGLFLIGLDKLTFGKPMYINFSEQLLTSDVITLLPKAQTVIEVLETVKPTQKVLKACKKLKQQGYVLALDDFVYHPRMKPLIDLADIIKVDFMAESAFYCEQIPQQLGGKGLRFLAEKVETYEQFKQAVAWGYTLFQGYFFCKPDILTTGSIEGNRLVYFQLLQELNDPEININRLEKIIQTDVSLAYKLLRYLNSAAVGLRVKIESIKHAITLLGTDNLAKFISMVLLQQASKRKPHELIYTAIIRGRFCELIAENIGLSAMASDAFLIGLFSLLDALLDRSMQDILAELSLKESIHQALAGRSSQLTMILETVIAYERAGWEEFELRSQALNLESALAKNLYLEAVTWAWSFRDQANWAKLT